MPRETKKIPVKLQRVIADAADGRSIEPQLADLASHFFHAAGGPKAVAQMLYREYRQAREGSVVRQRILDMVLRCVRFANEQNPRPVSFEHLSTEDVDREVAAILAELMGSMADAQEESRSDPEGTGDGPAAGSAPEGGPTQGGGSPGVA